MEQPLVSVIVPVYNAKLHIARCVESIRRQSYPNLEIILVNDGSSDVSLQVADVYARADKRILLIDKDNSGVSATRNLAISMATGKYLQFVDSDDYLAPDATRLLVEKAEQNTADLVIAPYYRVETHKPLFSKNEEDSYQTIEQYGFLDAGFYDKTTFARGLMKEPASFYYGVMWNKLYRRDIVHNHGIQCNVDLGWSEDLLFNLEYIRYAFRFYALEQPVYYYVKNPQSITATQLGLRNTMKMLSTKASLFAYYKKLYEDLGLYEENRLQIYKYLVAVAEA